MTPITPKQWRENKDLSQEAVAEQLRLHLRSREISAAHVSMLENGKRLPSFDVLDAYEIVSGGLVTKASFKSINT